MTSSSATNGTAIRDGRELHWTSAGKGDPAVLLEAGVAASSSEWDPIFGRVAGLTRVVAYDRIGYRNSGPGDVSADAALLDLEAVLADAGATGSLVLVGHSWGGVLGGPAGPCAGGSSDPPDIPPPPSPWTLAAAGDRSRSGAAMSSPARARQHCGGGK